MARVKVLAPGGLNTNEVLKKNPDIESDQAVDMVAFVPDGTTLKKPYGVSGYGRPAMWMKVQAPENDKTSIEIAYKYNTQEYRYTFTYSGNTWHMGSSSGTLIALLRDVLVGCTVWQPSSESKWYVIEPPAGISITAVGGSVMIPATTVSATSSFISLTNASLWDMVTVGDFTYTYADTYNPSLRYFTSAGQLADLIEADYGQLIDPVVSSNIVYLAIGAADKIIYLSAAGGIAVTSWALGSFYPNIFTLKSPKAAFAYHAPDGSASERYVVVADHVLADCGNEIFVPVFRSDNYDVLKLVPTDDVSAAQLYNTVYLSDGVEDDSALYGRGAAARSPDNKLQPFFNKIEAKSPPQVSSENLYLLLARCESFTENLPSELTEPGGGNATITWSQSGKQDEDTSGPGFIPYGNSQEQRVRWNVVGKRETPSVPFQAFAELKPNSSSSKGVNLRKEGNVYFGRGVVVRLWIWLRITDNSAQGVNEAYFLYDKRTVSVFLVNPAKKTAGQIINAKGEIQPKDVVRNPLPGGGDVLQADYYFELPDGQLDFLTNVRQILIYIPRPTNPGLTVTVMVRAVELISDFYGDGSVQAGVTYYNPNTNQETPIAAIEPIDTTQKVSDVIKIKWPHPNAPWKSRVYMRVSGGIKGDSGWRLVDEIDAGTGEATKVLNRSAFSYEQIAPNVRLVPDAVVKGRVMGVLRSSSRLVLMDCVEGTGTAKKRSSQRVWISNQIDPLDPYNIAFPQLPPSGYPLPDDVRTAEHYGMVLDIPSTKRVNGLAEVGNTAYFFCDDVITRLRGNSPVDWVHSVVSSYLGCPSPYGFTTTPYGIAFVGSDGAVWLLEVRAEDTPELLRELGREGQKLYSCPIKYRIREWASAEPTFDLSRASAVFTKNSLVVSCRYNPTDRSESFTFIFDFLSGVWYRYYLDAAFRRGLTQISRSLVPGIGVTDELLIYEHLGTARDTAKFPTLANLFVPGLYGIKKADGGIEGTTSRFMSRIIRVAPPGFETRIRRIILDVDYEFEDNNSKTPQPDIAVFLYNRNAEESHFGVIGNVASVKPITKNGRSRVVIDKNELSSVQRPSAAAFWGNAIVIWVNVPNLGKRFDVHGIEVETYGLRKEPV